MMKNAADMVDTMAVKGGAVDITAALRRARTRVPAKVTRGLTAMTDTKAPAPRKGDTEATN